MQKTTHSIDQIIDKQVKRWQITQGVEETEPERIDVITISREPGSGGRIIAGELAEKLGYDLFHQEVVHEIAASSKVSERLLNTLDEKGISVLGDWVSSLVNDRHLWPDQYLKYLLKVIGTIGRHGRAVIVGRGANFALPLKKRFSVRIVAPRKIRIENVSHDFSVTSDEAERRIIKSESDRRAFIRKYFHADIADPTNYDLVINMEKIGINAAVEAVRTALQKIVI